MNKKTIDQFKNISLFRELPEQDMSTLAPKMSERSYAAGETLMRKGDTGDSLFLIVEGTIQIVSETASGERLVLNQCGPGETVGEMSLLDRSPRSATVIAATQAKILELHHKDFLDILEQHPELALALIRSTTSRLRFATTYIEKAIEWSKHIAEGDYSSAMKDIQITKPDGGEKVTDDVKANQLLSAFFQMVQEVKAREEQLKQEVRKLTLEIDEARRKQQVQEVTGSEFYAQLKTEAARLRRERQEGNE